MMYKYSMILTVVLLLSSCNNEIDLAMRYQKVLLAQKGKENVYCYCLAWAIDAEAYFISSNDNICMGFDSTKDYCYGKGNQVIYYKFESDTLKIFSYGSKPTIPQTGSIAISLINLENSALPEYENKWKDNQIDKVLLDSFKKVPCRPVAPPIDLLNLKFDSKSE